MAKKSYYQNSEFTKNNIEKIEEVIRLNGPFSFYEFDLRERKEKNSKETSISDKELEKYGNDIDSYLNDIHSGYINSVISNINEYLLKKETKNVKIITTTHRSHYIFTKYIQKNLKKEIIYISYFHLEYFDFDMNILNNSVMFIDSIDDSQYKTIFDKKVNKFFSIFTNTDSEMYKRNSIRIQSEIKHEYNNEYIKSISNYYKWLLFDYDMNLALYSKPINFNNLNMDISSFIDNILNNEVVLYHNERSLNYAYPFKVFFINVDIKHFSDIIEKHPYITNTQKILIKCIVEYNIDKKLIHKLQFSSNSDSEITEIYINCNDLKTNTCLDYEKTFQYDHEIKKECCYNCLINNFHDDVLKKYIDIIHKNL